MIELQRNRTALITGGAGGIGYELSKLIAADGYNLVLVDIDEIGVSRAAQHLKSDFGIDVEIVIKDLSSPSAPREIIETLKSREIKVDLLVNNAGFGLSGNFVELSLEAQMNMLQVNINTVVALTRLLLPEMMSLSGAAILNVASIAAFQPGPYMSAYFASKAFVLSWSEGLAKELEGTGVTVTTLCPPPTDTGFASRAGSGSSIAFRKRFMASPAEVAKEAWRGLKNKERIVLPCFLNKLAVFTSRFLPRKCVTFIAAMMNRPDTKIAPPRRSSPIRTTSEMAMPRAI